MTDVVLTPTGARPVAFAQCVKHMRAQTRKTGITWIIVDDGPETMDVPAIEGWDILHLRPTPYWKPGQVTLGRNLLHGLRFVDDHVDKVVIVEDDDWYAAWWLEEMFKRLDHDDLVGESHSVYRHLQTGKRRDCNNAKHASLCSTGFKGSVIQKVRNIAAHEKKFIDIKLWNSVKGKLYKPDPRGVVGIKGFPGRPGIGVGHRQ